MRLDEATSAMTSRLRATLDHLGLGSPDPAALAAFYSRAMGLAVTPRGDGDWWGEAPDRRLHILPGAAKSLAYAAYRVDDPAELDALKHRLAAAGVPTEPSPSPRFETAICVRDPDDNRFVFGLAGSGDALPGVGTAADLPARLQHLVVASRHPGRIVDFFRSVLGFVLSDNVVDGEGGVRTSFLRCSDEHHNFAVFQAPEDRLDHHCYEAVEWNAIRDWSDHMADERILLQWGPGRHGPGNNLFMFVHDLDGNWLEISAELERCAPDRPAGEWPHEERTLNSWGRGFLRS